MANETRPTVKVSYSDVQEIVGSHVASAIGSFASDMLGYSVGKQLIDAGYAEKYSAPDCFSSKQLILTAAGFEWLLNVLGKNNMKEEIKTIEAFLALREDQAATVETAATEAHQEAVVSESAAIEAAATFAELTPIIDAMLHEIENERNAVIKSDISFRAFRAGLHMSRESAGHGGPALHPADWEADKALARELLRLAGRA